MIDCFQCTLHGKLPPVVNGRGVPPPSWGQAAFAFEVTGGDKQQIGMRRCGCNNGYLVECYLGGLNERVVCLGVEDKTAQCPEL